MSTSTAFYLLAIAVFLIGCTKLIFFLWGPGRIVINKRVEKMISKLEDTLSYLFDENFKNKK